MNHCVRAAAARFDRLGADVQEVSIPEHLLGPAVWTAVVIDGLWRTLSLNGLGYNFDGIYSPALCDSMDGWQARLKETPENVRFFALMGRYMERYHGRYYNKGKNLTRSLAKAYDSALTRYDLLLMPTTVQKASRNPPSLAEASIELVMELAFNNTFNTCQFNLTGHPALSIPCGLREGLPIGLMLIGRYFDETTVYRAAHAFEQSGDWREI